MLFKMSCSNFIAVFWQGFTMKSLDKIPFYNSLYRNVKSETNTNDHKFRFHTFWCVGGKKNSRKMLEVSMQDFYLWRKITSIRNSKEFIFSLEKPGREHLNQMINIHLTSNETYCYQVPPCRLFWEGHNIFRGILSNPSLPISISLVSVSMSMFLLCFVCFVVDFHI